jgi:hypothetical protein
MIPRHIPLFFLISGVISIFIASGCRGGGFVLVEWDKSHLVSANSIDKLVILDPEFIYLNEEESSIFIEERERNKLRYSDILSGMGRIADLETEVVVSEKLTDKDVIWFNTLASLKRHLFRVNFVQSSNQIANKKTGYGRVPTRYSKALPILDPKYAMLSKELGTSFVASSICVVANKRIDNLEKGRTLLLHIVVNIETGKTVFREVRELTGFPTDTRLKGAIYDSFNILANPKSPNNLWKK